MMFKKQRRIIRDTEELSKKLDPHFVLLVGSAVSGASAPHLPMVPEVLSGILCRAKARLKSDDYRDYTLDKYASSLLSKRGRYSAILKSTKFEEFLWQIETVMDSREARDDLLESLYVCDENEFGLNHGAITTLLNRGNCTACLTTNFDNALERSDPDLVVHCYQGRPLELPDFNHPPILLKLHGDARSRNCVATSPELYWARELGGHEYLQKFLAHKTVLVVGYSGFGDVDISPHLAYAEREYDTDFIWGVRNGKDRVPDFAKYKAVLDLSSADPSKNLLHGLAARHGWPDHTSTQDRTSASVPERRKRLEEWCNHRDDNTLRRLLLSILEGQVGWHTLHIFHSSSDASDSSLWPLVHGRGCLKVSAYVSAEESIAKALSSMESWTREKVESIMFLGFAQWRHGHLEEAIQTLRALVDLKIDSFAEKDQPTIANACRVYLEVCRDWMQLKRHVRDRRGFYDEKTLSLVIGRLKKLPAKVDVGDRILTDIVIANVRRLIGEKVEFSEVQESYDESFNYMYWEVAEAAARVMVTISFPRGLLALLKVDYEHVKRGNWNRIRQSSAAAMHSLFRGRFPFILSFLNGPMLASLKTPLVEWRYKGKRHKWEKQRRNWRETMAERDKDGEAPRTEVEMPKFSPSLWRIGVAGVFILLSLVSSITIKGVELEGGATLAALAALVLFWPLIPQLFIRGGAAEFLGLKIKLNAIERRTEEGVGVRVEELAADLETLRLKVDSVVDLDPSRALAKAPVIPTKGRERLDEAVQQYADHPETEQWDLRVAVDKRLIAAGPFDVSGLLDAGVGDLEDREYAMALAVALGTIEPGAREDEAVGELSRLLVNRSARVRYRAARSIMRLLRRKDLKQDSRFTLVEASRARLNVEKMGGVRGELIGILSDFG